MSFVGPRQGYDSDRVSKAIGKIQDLPTLYRLYQKDPMFDHLHTLDGEPNRFVPGAGCITSPKLSIVGEAPGHYEAFHGVPFIGPAGQLLDAFITGLQLQRKDVFITNVIHYRPSLDNRTPSEGELYAARPYLLRELELVESSTILALGRVAADVIFDFVAPPPQRGIPLSGPIEDTTAFHLFHPAACLRNSKWLEASKRHWGDVAKHIGQPMLLS